MNIIEVKLDYNNCSSFFRNSKFSLKKGLTVIVDTDKGLQFGTIIRIISDDKAHEFDSLDLGNVVRISSKKDYLHYLENNKLAENAIIKCREMVMDNNLNMTILDACYNFDRSQLLFRFVADERVDFRNLAKELGSLFKTRIELRQIGIRDKAKEIGGIGPCGRLLCCSSFLKSFDSVTINMAKNQNVSLNPTKINGVCGRLLCCLKYENDIYSEIKKDFPKVGSHIVVDGNDGKVISVNYLKRNYIVEFSNKNKVEYDVDDYKK